MTASHPFLSPSEAARRLGVSPKALRLYEQRGLLQPARTAAGWRAYGAQAMARASEIAGLRRLGLTLTEVGRVLEGEASALLPALAAHEAGLERQIGRLSATLDQVRELRNGLVAGRAIPSDELARMAGSAQPGVAFHLPWPWGGERFELPAVSALTYLVGPLGSGKTRLARLLAEALPEGRFFGLDRAEGGSEGTPDSERLVERLVADGATASTALEAVAVALASSEAVPVVLDLIEHGLDGATQEVVGDVLRLRRVDAPPLVVMTRSTAILDLGAVPPQATILLCPANHSPPTLVAPVEGAAGYEAVATCLAPPEVRARSEGIVITLPAAAQQG